MLLPLGEGRDDVARHLEPHLVELGLGLPQLGLGEHDLGIGVERRGDHLVEVLRDRTLRTCLGEAGPRDQQERRGEDRKK